MSNDSNASTTTPPQAEAGSTGNSGRGGNHLVAQHERKGRRDRVGEALKAASALRNPRTVIDWMIEYSKGQYDASKPYKDQTLWHLDPVALRSAVTQAQQRLHVPAPEVKTTTGDIIYKAHAGGDFMTLLGDKLFPSAPESGKQRTGKTPRWCKGIPERPDTQTVPDGLSNPEIVNLVGLAVQAGHPDYGNGDYIAKLAKQSQSSRARDIEELSGRFRQENLLARQAASSERKAAKAIEERDQALIERDTAQAQLKLLEDMKEKFEGIDLSKLAEVFAKPIDPAAAAASVQ